MQSFTFLPGVRRHLPAAGAQLVKQEPWELDHISHNAPGFSPDLSYYDSCDLPVHCGPPAPNIPRLHHPPPPPPSDALQTSLMFPHSSSSSQTLVPLQTFTIPPQVSSSSASLQTFTIPPQTSSLPPHTSPIVIVGPQRDPSPSLSPGRGFVTPADPHRQKDSLLPGPGEVLTIKQEPEEQRSLGSLGLQEITLDDGESQQETKQRPTFNLKNLSAAFSCNRKCFYCGNCRKCNNEKHF